MELLTFRHIVAIGISLLRSLKQINPLIHVTDEKCFIRGLIPRDIGIGRLILNINPENTG